ncbi:hypothetical protein FRC11_015006 [Ceratobasidium sp. 423]|nr:hypothetical protein FRC11_015006 [Ceratobasidium sp. 423]
MTLNNILQRQGRTSALIWKETSAGPAHDPTWTVAALIDRVEYGYGICARKMDARQEAARKALEALNLVEMTDKFQ